MFSNACRECYAIPGKNSWASEVSERKWYVIIERILHFEYEETLDSLQFRRNSRIQLIETLMFRTIWRQALRSYVDELGKSH